ncbi:MAG: recombinase RecF [Acetobacteraceae bacterium]|nr:recombinase RecF [Acetobacteraceae bacterium]
MLTRIRIKGYKSLQDVEVRLPALALLMGPNAAGKSNFLDCLQLLSKLTTSRTLKEAFEPPYRGKPLESFTFGPGGVRESLSSQTLRFSIEADIQLSQQVIDAVDRQIRDMRRTNPNGPEAGEEVKKAVREKYLRYKIVVEMLPRTGFLRVADEYLAALSKNGEPTKSRVPFLYGEGDRLRMRLEGQGHPIYHDRLLDHSILSLPHYPPHYPHLVAARQEFASWLFFYFEPRERMRSSNAVKEVRHIGQMGEELASYLNTLKALSPKQFENFQRSLRVILPQAEGIGVEVNDLGEIELTMIENGTAIPARLLSEGTLRILGLLALGGAGEQPSLVGFEEPENGIHPTRIETVAELLRNRAADGDTQYIVTTHSPMLPDLIRGESLFVCKRVNGATDISPLEQAIPGPLFNERVIDDALKDMDELTFSERMRRGDFND